MIAANAQTRTHKGFSENILHLCRQERQCVTVFEKRSKALNALHGQEGNNGMNLGNETVNGLSYEVYVAQRLNILDKMKNRQIARNPVWKSKKSYQQDSMILTECR